MQTPGDALPNSTGMFDYRAMANLLNMLGILVTFAAAFIRSADLRNMLVRNDKRASC
jgi:hypothetical protein